MSNKFSRQLNKIKKQRLLFVALIFVLLAIMTWTSVSILSTYQKGMGVSPEVERLASPLTPNLDLDVLNRLETKKYFDHQDLERFPIFVMLRDERSGEISIVDVVDNQIITDFQEEFDDSDGVDLDDVVTPDFTDFEGELLDLDDPGQMMDEESDLELGEEEGEVAEEESTDLLPDETIDPETLPGQERTD